MERSSAFRLDGWPEPDYRDPERSQRASDRAWERLRRDAARLATGLARIRDKGLQR